MTLRGYKILGCCVVALILTVMLSQFRLSWNKSALLFAGLFIMAYFITRDEHD